MACPVLYKGTLTLWEVGETVDIHEIRRKEVQSGPKKFIHFLLINIFGINLNEISISGLERNIMFSQQMAQALL